MAVNVSFSPLRSLGACRYGNSNEWEQVVHAEAEARSYRRLSSSLEGSCNIIDGVDVGVRGFVGALKAEDGVSDRVRFNPQNGGEARIRIDAPVLDKVDKISTIGVDVLAPAPLPLPSWMMTVNRQTRVRGFYDYGESWDPHVHYKDAGVGLWLPFGGDVVGKGSVQFINFSLSAVLYREAGDLRSRAPGFVFDFGFANK